MKHYLKGWFGSDRRERTRISEMRTCGQLNTFMFRCSIGPPPRPWKGLKHTISYVLPLFRSPRFPPYDIRT